MTDEEEIKALEKIKRRVQKEVHAGHDITEMDIECPECKAAIFVAFINQRIDFLKWLKS